MNPFLDTFKIEALFLAEYKGTKKWGFLKGSTAVKQHQQRGSAHYIADYLSSSNRLASNLRKMKRNMVNAHSEEPP